MLAVSPSTTVEWKCFILLFDPICSCIIIPVCIKCSASSSTFDTERCIKMKNWFTNDCHKYFPEGIYHNLQSVAPHITMQMSKPSCFSIYWNTHHHFSLLSVKSIFLNCTFFFTYSATHQKATSTLTLVRIILNMPTGTSFACILQNVYELCNKKRSYSYSCYISKWDAATFSVNKREKYTLSHLCPFCLLSSFYVMEFLWGCQSHAQWH